MYTERKGNLYTCTQRKIVSKADGCPLFLLIYGLCDFQWLNDYKKSEIDGQGDIPAFQHQ